MCVVLMLMPDNPHEHEHACGHRCECERAESVVCDRCAIGHTVAARYPSQQLSIGEALARLYISLHSIAQEEPRSGRT